jgi:hypothetical protein
MIGIAQWTADNPHFICPTSKCYIDITPTNSKEKLAELSHLKQQPLQRSNTKFTFKKRQTQAALRRPSFLWYIHILQQKEIQRNQGSSWFAAN